MMAVQAAEILNGMKYRPHTTVIAEATGPWTVGLMMVFPAYNSDPVPPGRQSYEAELITPPIEIDVRSLDKEGVQAAGLNGLIEVEIHEAREFWRERTGRQVAPFHPHNKSGEAAWQRTRAIPVKVDYPEPNGA